MKLFFTLLLSLCIVGCKGQNLDNESMISTDKFVYSRADKLISTLEEQKVKYHEVYVESNNVRVLNELTKSLLSIADDDLSSTVEVDGLIYRLNIFSEGKSRTVDLPQDILFQPDLLLLNLNSELSFFKSVNRIYRYPLPTDQSIYIVASQKELEIIWSLGFCYLGRKIDDIFELPTYPNSADLVHFDLGVVNEQVQGRIIDIINKCFLRVGEYRITNDRFFITKSNLFDDRFDFFIDDRLIGWVIENSEGVSFPPGGGNLIVLKAILSIEKIKNSDFYFTNYLNLNKDYRDPSLILSKISSLMNCE